MKSFTRNSVQLKIKNNYKQLNKNQIESNQSHRINICNLLRSEFTYWIYSNAPLIITSVKPSCGCTGAVTDGENEYSEGESGTIKITFNTQGREGHQEKQVHVFSNDIENPDKVLTFSCEVVNGQ